MSSPRRHGAFIGLLAALVLAMFGGVLVTPRRVVLSRLGTDLSSQFLAWRSFGFGELRNGHLALWNPHLFSGAPFFGGMQAALLYPPNALFLFLPVDRAVNWSIALHVFLAGAFTYAWAAKRALWRPAAFLAGAMFMFGGAYFYHIYAGHLPNLSAMVWAPLLFLAIDGLFDEPSLKWCLLGMFAVAMQVLAGHPQYVFYAGVAAILYCGLNLYGSAELFASKPGRRRLIATLGGMAAIAAGGMALSATQLVPALEESSETLRGAGVPYEFAAMFSFPPENVLTAVAPNFFGDAQTVPYWGRCYAWEMSLFAGVSGLALALVGAIYAEPKIRRFSTAMAGLTFLLALGDHTPLFQFLYYTVPGFDRFRGSSKFIFLTALFIAMLAAAGLDALRERLRPAWLLCGGLAGAGVAMLAGWVWMNWGDAVDLWAHVAAFIRSTGESYLPPGAYSNAEFLQRTLGQAASSVLAGGMVLLLVAGLLAAARWRREAVLALLAVSVVELFAFAHGTLQSFDLAQAQDPVVTQWLRDHPGDGRILDLVNPNAALETDALDIWGNDPAIERRYAEFVAFTQDAKPEEATQYVQWRRDRPLLDLLRLRAIFDPANPQTHVSERTSSLPHVLIVPKYRVAQGRESILAAMNSPGFDGRAEVILESQPDPGPVPTDALQAVRVIAETSDTLTIEADLAAPSVVLVTDTYSRNWHAHSVGRGTPAEYAVLPADYCLRALALPAGHHVVEMEYRPAGFATGEWISGIALVMFCGLCAWNWRRA